MIRKLLVATLVVAASVSAVGAWAQTAPSDIGAPGTGYATLATLPVPVVAGDVTDRPYRVIGEVKAGVRKATVFSKAASQDKVYRELWERGKKVGADAVIFAQYGDAHVSMMSWGQTDTRGTAVKFLTAEEAAAAATTATPVAAPVDSAAAITPGTAN